MSKQLKKKMKLTASSDQDSSEGRTPSLQAGPDLSSIEKKLTSDCALESSAGGAASKAKKPRKKMHLFPDAMAVTVCANIGQSSGETWRCLFLF